MTELEQLQQRVRELEDELKVTDELLAERNKILDDLPCPEHGPCVPYVRVWIRNHKASDRTSTQSKRRA